MNPITQAYLDGVPFDEMCSKFKTSYYRIVKTIREDSVPLTRKRARKYKVNENYFDIIDTEDKAYFLGLLFADG